MCGAESCGGGGAGAGRRERVRASPSVLSRSPRKGERAGAARSSRRRLTPSTRTDMCAGYVRRLGGKGERAGVRGRDGGEARKRLRAPARREEAAPVERANADPGARRRPLASCALHTLSLCLFPLSPAHTYLRLGGQVDDQQDCQGVCCDRDQPVEREGRRRRMRCERRMVGARLLLAPHSLFRVRDSSARHATALHFTRPSRVKVRDMPPPPELPCREVDEGEESSVPRRMPPEPGFRPEDVAACAVPPPSPLLACPPVAPGRAPPGPRRS